MRNGRDRRVFLNYKTQGPREQAQWHRVNHPMFLHDAQEPTILDGAHEPQQQEQLRTEQPPRWALGETYSNS